MVLIMINDIICNNDLGQDKTQRRLKKIDNIVIINNRMTKLGLEINLLLEDLREHYKYVAKD